MSLLINLLIVLSAVWACGNLTMGWLGVTVGSDILATLFSNLKIYAFGAAILACIASLIYFISDIVSLSKKKATPKWVNVLKLVSVVALLLSAAVTFILNPFILSTSPAYDFVGQLQWTGTLFLSVVAPVLALVSYIFFECEPKVRLVHSIWTILPSCIYIGVMAVCGQFIASFLPAAGSVTDPYALFRFDGSHQWYYYVLILAIVVVGCFLAGLLILALRNVVRKHAVTEVSAAPELVSPEESVIAKETESAKAEKQKQVEEPKKAVEQPKAAAPVASSSSAPVQKQAVASSSRPASSTPHKTGKKVLIIKKSKSDNIQITEDYSGNEETEEAQEAQAEAAAKANPSSGHAVQRVYHISKQPSGKWQVKLATGERAIKLFDTQEQAIYYAKALVRTQGGSIRVHSLTGKMRKE